MAFTDVLSEHSSLSLGLSYMLFFLVTHTVHACVHLYSSPSGIDIHPINVYKHSRRGEHFLPLFPLLIRNIREGKSAKTYLNVRD